MNADRVGFNEFIPLVRQLAQEQARLATKRGGALRAYLLFERWRDNPLAARFAEAYPRLAAARIAVPDDLYEGQSDDAPCIVALDARVLPADPGQSLSDFEAHEWLGGFLCQAWREAQQRRSLQGFCGVLLAPVDGGVLARYLSRLGYQHAPDGQARLLRFQDPRVLQRLWPALAESQRREWLGPIESWWMLPMPWGPIGQPPPLGWFVVAPSKATPEFGAFTPRGRSVQLDPRQWLMAHATAPANALWARYEEEGIPSPQQPSARQMDDLLATAFGCGIQANALEKFLLCAWEEIARPASSLSRADVTAKFGTRCVRIAELIRQNPQTGFRQLLTQIA